MDIERFGRDENVSHVEKNRSVHREMGQPDNFPGEADPDLFYFDMEYTLRPWFQDSHRKWYNLLGQVSSDRSQLREW